MKTKSLVISLSDQELNALRKMCFAAATTPAIFVRALLQRFLADPEKFICVLNSKNNGTDVPGADELSK